MVLFSDVLDNFADVPNWVRAALALSLLMYEPVCTTFGATLGQHKMQIRVRKIGDETKPINLFQAIIRYFFKILLGWLSFISIFMSNKSRAIHDIVSGSVMVNAKTEA